MAVGDKPTVMLLLMLVLIMVGAVLVGVALFMATTGTVGTA